MKPLYESILKSTGAGKAGMKDYINSVKINTMSINHDFSGISFKDFLTCVDDSVMVNCLKLPFKEANKSGSMGRVSIRFSDGILGIEIMTLGRMFSSGDKLWREAFVKNEDLGYENKKYVIPRVSSFTNVEAYEKAGKRGCGTFTTKWGERLKAVVGGYIEYLKKHYNDLYE